MIGEEKRDLAIKYIHKRLTSEQKMEVFNLISSDPQFKNIFLEEYKIYKVMLNFKATLGNEKKEKLYSNIKKEINTTNINKEFIKDYVVDVTLNASLPVIASNIINKFKKERLSYV